MSIYRVFRIIFSIVGILLLIIGITVFIFTQMGVTKVRLKNYSEYSESFLTTKGWTPLYLPRSMRNIRAKINLDSNTVTMNFDYAKHDYGLVAKYCSIQQVSSSKLKAFYCPDMNLRVDFKETGKARLYSTPIHKKAQ